MRPRKRRALGLGSDLTLKRLLEGMECSTEPQACVSTARPIVRYLRSYEAVGG